MTAAFIETVPVAPDRAIERAAEILADARFPVIAGLGTDIVGARAAIRLAERLSGAVDHLASDPFLRYARVVQDAGIMATTPGEVRRRCDLLVMLRGGSAAIGHLWHTPQPDLIRLDPEPGQRSSFAPRDPETLVAELRARLHGRPVRSARAGLDDLLARLRGAAFVVFACDPGLLDPLDFEMLCGLVKDLNAVTRCSLLRVDSVERENVEGVNDVALWLTGCPVRIGFGRGRPEHDPWRFEASRLVDSGEADAAVWISALGHAAPPWRRTVPLIALTVLPDSLAASVRLEVGRPGIDHPGVVASGETGALAFRDATTESERPSVSTLIERIEARLPPC